MNAYFYFGSDGQNEIHEMVQINEVPQCGDRVTAQDGTRAVVTNVVVSEETSSDPLFCPVEVYCHH